MKVGTDGVLLGAWVNTDNAERILDVGAGSGLISLMLAQRNNGALIDAIEIDTCASDQANENFRNSPFSNISGCRNISFQEYVQDSDIKYDLIVSNPPFFNRSLKAPDIRRSTARHNDTLMIEDFICLPKKLLSPEGRIAFIYPIGQKEYIVSLAKENNLYLSRLTEVLPTPLSAPKRILIELSVCETRSVFFSLVIETERHVYSPDFRELVRDFYLNM